MRTIQKVIKGSWQNEGVGAKVIRSVGSRGFERCDPFLMLDEFHVEQPAGFPAHPHRGFETLTYMISGEFQHEDFMGNKGKIKSGDFQYMTAGRGVVHSEQPFSKKAHGLQLWINLPKSKKMMEPRYQDQIKENVPTTTIGDASIKVIAGDLNDTKANVFTQTPMCYFDISLNGTTQIPLRNDFHGFLYILEGECMVNDKLYDAHNTLVLNECKNDQNLDTISLTSKQPCRVFLIAGVPINEPIAQRGPFVMNSEHEIAQAMQDFYEGKNGFEKAVGFEASIDQ